MHVLARFLKTLNLKKNTFAFSYGKKDPKVIFGLGNINGKVVIVDIM